MKFLPFVLAVAAFTQCAFAVSETSLGVLEELNLARTCPKQYAHLLSRRMQEGGAGSRQSVAEAIAFLNKVKPLPPLEFSDGLMLGAAAHISDQGAHGGIGHVGSDRSHPWDRMARFGRWSGSAGENISYGYSTAQEIVATLIVDEGVPSRGHRKNIFSSNFAVAGVACGSHVRFGSMCVIDFAGGFAQLDAPKLAASASQERGVWNAFDTLRTR